MTSPRLYPRWIPWLLAAAFVAVQAIALAHEIKHDLRQHDDASCVLHLQVKSVGGDSHGTLVLAPHYTGLGAIPGSDITIDLPLRPTGYHSRAPPSIVR